MNGKKTTKRKRNPITREYFRVIHQFSVEGFPKKWLVIEPGFNGDLEHCLDVGTGQSAYWDGETSLNMRSDSPLDAFMEHPIDQNEGILLKPIFCVKKTGVNSANSLGMI